MASLYTQVPSVSKIFSLYTSFSAIMMLFRTILNEIVSKQIRKYITVKFVDLFSSYFQTSFAFVIDQKWEFCSNQTYLATRLAGLDTKELLVSSNDLKNPESELKLGVPVNTKIIDDFEGIHLEWILHSVETKSYPYEKQCFHLTCKKEFREKIMTDYFKYFAKSAEKITGKCEILKIYTYNHKGATWESAIFEHHTTFETLAFEPHLKTTMIDDLDGFSNGKDFFKSGEFLPPPRTGQFFSLKTFYCGADATSRHQSKKEEENDQLQKKKQKRGVGVSLSGLLNFVDGLWSSCGEERTIIFTTNHKEKLDQALLRPRRMDVHILIGYCTPFVFKKLVTMYLKIDDHVLFDNIEKLVIEVSVTLAEVTQQLMACKNADIALKGLLEFLKTKKLKKEDDTKVEEEKETEDAETKEAEA